MDSVGKRWVKNVVEAGGRNAPVPQEERPKTTVMMEGGKKTNPARQQYKQNLLNSLSGGGQAQGGNQMAVMAGGM